MRKTFKIFVFIISGLIFFPFFTSTFSYAHSHLRVGMYIDVLPRGYSIFHVRGRPYYYHHGKFYRKVRLGYIVVAPPFGVVIPVLPFGTVRVFIGGFPYFFCDGLYYRECPGGYVLVPEWEIEELRRKERELYDKEKELESKKEEISENEFIINVPNKDGSYTPVKLKKAENGYIGPQGEFYKDNPTVEQLKVLYGK